MGAFLSAYFHEIQSGHSLTSIKRSSGQILAGEETVAVLNMAKHFIRFIMGRPDEMIKWKLLILDRIGSVGLMKCN